MGTPKGILMHISSLPSCYGIGNLGKEAYGFVDFLKGSGQEFWQILPQNPTGYADSPYQSVAAFAGNPYFIDIDRLILEGLLKKEETDNYFFGKNPKRVDFEKIFFYRYPLLRYAFQRFLPNREYEEFLEENSFWLDEYALFMAIKEKNHYKSWLEWEEPLKNRDEKALDIIRKDYEKTIEFYKFLQYEFFKSWYELKEYANENGIKIIGDIPIYVAEDSVDLWANRENFQFFENGKLRRVAATPTEVWGNPIYNWEEMKKDGYSWWQKRFLMAEKMYDMVRIDHFGGFFEYYSVDGDSRDLGKIQKHQGYGKDLFSKIPIKCGVIAENLGLIPKECEEIMKKYGFMGMNILQFSVNFKEKKINYRENEVFYTGNHDNNTILGWFESLSDNKKRILRKILNVKPSDDILPALIGKVTGSNSKIAIIPIQDYLGEGEKERMNIPSTVGGNWLYRVTKEEMSPKLQEFVESF